MLIFLMCLCFLHFPFSSKVLALKLEGKFFLPLTLFTLPFLFSQDEKIMEEIPDRLESKLSKSAWETFSALGDGKVELLTLGAIYLLPQEYHRQSVRLAFKSMIKASLYTWILKVSFGRARPYEKEKGFFGPSLTHHSFPSGHTATIFAIAKVFGERYKIKKATYLLAILTGVSRVILKKHYPTDVIAGALVGYLAGEEVLNNNGGDGRVIFLPDKEEPKLLVSLKW